MFSSGLTADRGAWTFIGFKEIGNHTNAVPPQNIGRNKHKN